MTLAARAIEAWRGWGTAEEERTQIAWPCQRYVPEPHETFFRGVDVAAPPDIVWRWLCQFRVGPYSYDWVDNAGRQSPRVLTPGADKLSLGQRILIIFRIVEFEVGEHITMTTRKAWHWLWGDVTCTYKVVPNGDGRSRLFLALTAHAIPGPIMGATGLYHLRRFFFPWGELIMVRKQLITVAKLAEAHARHLEEEPHYERPRFAARPARVGAGPHAREPSART